MLHDVIAPRLHDFKQCVENDLRVRPYFFRKGSNIMKHRLQSKKEVLHGSHFSFALAAGAMGTYFVAESPAASLAPPQARERMRKDADSQTKKYIRT